MPIQFGRPSTGNSSRIGQAWRRQLRFPLGIPISRRSATMAPYCGIGPGFFSGENLHRQLHGNRAQRLYTYYPRHRHPGIEGPVPAEQLCPNRSSQPRRPAPDMAGHQHIHQEPVTHQTSSYSMTSQDLPQQHISPPRRDAPRVCRTSCDVRTVFEGRRSGDGGTSLAPTFRDYERDNRHRSRVHQGAIFSDNDGNSEVWSSSEDDSGEIFDWTFFNSPSLGNTPSLSSDSMSDTSSLGDLSWAGHADRGRRERRARNGLGSDVRDSSSQSRRNWWFGSMPL